jgi:hypothetical protein
MPATETVQGSDRGKAGTHAGEAGPSPFQNGWIVFEINAVSAVGFGLIQFGFLHGLQFVTIDAQ